MNEPRDGAATVEWIAQQEWFDGNLGMWGQSYTGFTQWCAAQDAPRALKAIAPSIAGSQMNIFPQRALGLDTIIPWVYQLNRVGNFWQRLWHDIRRQVFAASFKKFFQRAFMHLPLREAEAVVIGKPVPYFRAWLDKPLLDDAAWKSNGHGIDAKKIRAATHFISGWYDILLHELTRDYAALRAQGKNPYLTIGAWIHASPACTLETLRESLFWFDAQLRGDGSRLRAQPVRIFVMGANEWREYKEWPPSFRATKFYLRDARALATAEPPRASAPDQYTYDPAQPTPALGGPLFFTDPGPVDNRPLEARADVLTYTTSPLEKNLEAIGPVRAELFVRSSRAHTDFFARVCDVYPNGKSINVCDNYIRVQPGVGEPQADGSLRIEIDLLPTAYRFARGHSIRLQISSGAHPRFDRNLGTGEPIGTGTRMLIAEQTIYHDAAHPSAVMLPITNHLDADERG
ncbi:MAG: CocE/NonD family hydrolase [Chloroflexi bacterium]|nr:CocE/NonD family hydrolase [Chloroflexota bacterium]